MVEDGGRGAGGGGWGESPEPPREPLQSELRWERRRGGEFSHLIGLRTALAVTSKLYVFTTLQHCCWGFIQIL